MHRNIRFTLFLVLFFGGIFSVTAQNAPDIDRDVPAGLETAEFALG